VKENLVYQVAKHPDINPARAERRAKPIVRVNLLTRNVKPSAPIRTNLGSYPHLVHRGRLFREVPHQTQAKGKFILARTMGTRHGERTARDELIDVPDALDHPMIPNVLPPATLHVVSTDRRCVLRVPILGSRMVDYHS